MTTSNKERNSAWKLLWVDWKLMITVKIRQKKRSGISHLETLILKRKCEKCLLEITTYIYNSYFFASSLTLIVSDSGLEPLETEPPVMFLLVCDWLYSLLSCRRKAVTSSQSSVSDV